MKVDAPGGAARARGRRGHENISEVATFQTDAVLALKTLGFTKEVAARAVREALERDESRDLEGLVKAALRRCST
jgi:Holliday junction resolvasome RuvABC DNA-binding subunit